MSLMGILDRVADVDAFDKVIEPARRAVLAALKPAALKNFLHAASNVVMLFTDNQWIKLT